MKYQLTYTQTPEGKEDKTFTYEVEDTKMFLQQTKKFQNRFNQIRRGNMADFDDHTAMLLTTGRIIITEKEVDDEV
ncbi:MAG: hypothetical protein E6767_20360 [Dysgonomonas sp.]|nr:hypothetical protein [Dysgonomonas sp.]